MSCPCGRVYNRTGGEVLGVLALNITDCPDSGPPHGGAASLLHAASAAVVVLGSGVSCVVYVTASRRKAVTHMSCDHLSM